VRSVHVLETLLVPIGSIQEDISHVPRECNYMGVSKSVQARRTLNKKCWLASDLSVAEAPTCVIGFLLTTDKT